VVSGGVVASVVAGVVSSGGASSLAQAAPNPTIVMTAAAPATTERRRLKRSDLIVCLSYLSPDWKVGFRDSQIREQNSNPNVRTTAQVLTAVINP
jgi:hypothetical protein